MGLGYSATTGASVRAARLARTGGPQNGRGIPLVETMMWCTRRGHVLGLQQTWLSVHAILSIRKRDQSFHADLCTLLSCSSRCYPA